MISKKENCINISGTQKEQDRIDIIYELDTIIALSKLCKTLEKIINSNEPHVLYSKKEAVNSLREQLYKLHLRVDKYNGNKRKTQKRFPNLILEGSTITNLYHYPE